MDKFLNNSWKQPVTETGNDHEYVCEEGGGMLKT